MPCFDVLGDLQLSDDGRRLLYAQGVGEVAARCRAALQTVQGIWLYDSTVGMRYLFEILEKPAALGLLRSEVARVLRQVPGIVQVTRIAVSYNPANRTAAVEFNALTDQGPIQDGITIS